MLAGRKSDKRAVVVRRNALLFENMPSFTHLKPGDRGISKRQHVQWEDDLCNVPEAILHTSCVVDRGQSYILRETMAWLIGRYCQKQNVSLETLSASITAANANISMPGLVVNQPSTGQPIFNLLKLNDNELYRVYCSIPTIHRPAEKPRQKHCQREKRAPTHKIVYRGGIRKKIRLEPVAPVAQVAQVVEEEVAWVQCDDCDKWRRLYNTREDEVPDNWCCALHPDGITCETSEDQMGDGEQWNGDVNGSILRLTLAKPAQAPPNETSDTSSETPDPCSTEPKNEGFEMQGDAMSSDIDADDDVSLVDLFGNDDEC